MERDCLQPVELLSLFSAVWWPVADEFQVSKWSPYCGAGPDDIGGFEGAIFQPGRCASLEVSKICPLFGEITMVVERRTEEGRKCG
jgi:hypothetical protein